MEENQKKKSRIGLIAIVILVVAALIADLLSLIPFVGDIVGPLFWIGASIYFWQSGLGLVNGRRLATSIISMVAEMIPAIQELPLILAGIIAIIVMVRIEDKTGISLTPHIAGKGGMPLVQNGLRSPAGTPPPLNQGGIRAPGGGLVLK